MKIAKSLLLCAALFCLSSDFQANAKNILPLAFLQRKKASDTAKIEPAKTPYEKFINKKEIKKAEGFATIYRSGESILLEIPDSLIGRRVIFSNVITDCTSPDVIVGTDISENTVYEIAETDSMVLFLKPKRNMLAAKSDDDATSADIAKAIDKSNAGVILAAFPIKYRNGDSTSKVINATKLFSYSDRKSANIDGMDFGDYTISSTKFKTETSIFKTLFATPNSIGIDYEAEFELSLTTKILVTEVDDKPSLALDLRTALTLLPNPEAKPERRKADPRIGVLTVPYSTFSSTGSAKEEKWALRWDTRKPIRIYVDTLFSPSWFNAIRDGIEAWNHAFSEAGVPDAIEVLPYPSGPASSFFASAPLNSTVQFAGQGTEIGASVLTDPANAQILSCRITVPKDYVQSVRRNSVYAISDVDPRYQAYFLDDGAVCEVLKAQIMKYFSLCLGLKANAAGSYAYSPDQLRDPKFTSTCGITASVTDDVLFNYFTVPGDKERGAATITDRLGAYDIFAIRCLYGPAARGTDSGSTCISDSLLATAAGHPELAYSAYVNGYPDPRLVSKGLGNDNIAAFDAALSHLKFVASNADKWLSDDRIPETYRELFLDWIWIAYYKYTHLLSSEIGALITNEIEPGSETPKYETVPADLQKNCCARIFEEYRNMEWLQKNNTLLHIAGANKDVSNLTMLNLFACSGIDMRLPYVEASHKLADGTYTSEQFLDDLRREALKCLMKGDLSRKGEDVMVSAYLNLLVQHSPVLKRNYTEALANKGLAACALPSVGEDTDFRMNPAKIPAEYDSDLENQCYDQLEKALSDLKTCRTAAKSDYDRRRIDYLILFAEASLGKHNKHTN